MAWALRAVYEDEQPFEILNSTWPDAGDDNKYWKELSEEAKLDCFKQYYTDYDGSLDRIPPLKDEAETVMSAYQFINDSKEKARLSRIMGCHKPSPINPRSLPFGVWFCLDLMARIAYEWCAVNVPKLGKEPKPEDVQKQSEAYEAKDRIWRDILRDCESLERSKRYRREVNNG